MSGAHRDVQRVDGIDKVTGKPLYAADRMPEGMLHALPVIARAGQGRTSRIEVARALADPNVLFVLTPQDMDRLAPLPFLFAGGYGSQSFQPLQSDAVLYRGQAVALVVAETLEAAQ